MREAMYDSGMESQMSGYTILTFYDDVIFIN